MTTRRWVETLFSTAGDTTPESDSCVDDTELRATYIMFAKLTFSPLHTSTQLSVSAGPPIKTERRRRGEQKRQTSFCVPQCKHKGRKTDSMMQCHLCQLWVHYECIGEERDEAVGLWSCHHAKQCRVLSATGEHLSKLEATLIQLNDNNEEYIQLVEDQCNTNEATRNEKTALTNYSNPTSCNSTR